MTHEQILQVVAGLTDLERQALKLAFDSLKSNGHDFGFTADVAVPGLSGQANGALITNLCKNGLLSVCDDNIMWEAEDEDGRQPFADAVQLALAQAGQPKNPAAVALGRLGGLKGGKAKSDAKSSAARLNGAKGGRPRSK